MHANYKPLYAIPCHGLEFLPCFCINNSEFIARSLTLFLNTEWFDRGKEYGLKALKVFEEAVLSEFKGLIGDVGGELSSITKYDTADIKGLLVNVDKEKIKKLVERVRPLIPEYYDKAKSMATDIFEQGKEEFDKIREQVEQEVG